MVGRERLQYFACGSEADGQAGVLLEVDFEFLELNVDFPDSTDALSLHGDDGANVVGEDAPQAVDLLPGPRKVRDGSLEPHLFGQSLNDGALRVEFLQSGKDFLVENLSRVGNLTGRLENRQPIFPVLLAGELFVE